MAHIPDYVSDTQCLFWIWLALVLIVVLVALAGLLGFDYYRDIQALRRAVHAKPSRP